MALTPTQRAKLARGGSSKTDGKGASVNAKLLSHGGYRGAVGGGYAKSKASTAKENAKWIAGAVKRGLIAGAKKKAKSAKAGMAERSLAARRSRRGGY